MLKFFARQNHVSKLILWATNYIEKHLDFFDPNMKRCSLNMVAQTNSQKLRNSQQIVWYVRIALAMPQQIWLTGSQRKIGLKTALVTESCGPRGDQFAPRSRMTLEQADVRVTFKYMRSAWFCVSKAILLMLKYSAGRNHWVLTKILIFRPRHEALFLKHCTSN